MFESWSNDQYREADLEGLEARRQEIVDLLADAKSDVSTEELRSEIELIRDEYARRNASAQLRSLNISNVAAGAGQVIDVSNQVNRSAAINEEPQDMYDTLEYRQAFMEFVCRGTQIPAQYRADATTTTETASAVIPTTLMNEIIHKMDTYGNIWAKVRKLNVKGGVRIPLMELKPVAVWVGETEASDDQSLTADKYIEFSYYTLECKIAQTMLASVVTLPAFQALFVPLATEAIVRACEKAIISGDGNGKMLGIATDTRVPEENVITLSVEQLSDWSAWHKDVKAKMKKAYRNGDFIMNQASFDGYIDGMVDANGQPIGRVNYGINGEETYRFMGKSVETVEDDLIASFDDAAAGDVVAIFANLNDYVVNSNLQLETVKWVDHDNNQVKNKCTLIADGKLVDPNGVLVIKKGASA